MDNYTAVQLIAIAKERLVEPTPVLQPTPWRPSNIALKNKQNIKNDITKGMQKTKDVGVWLLNYISPKPKVVDKVLESFIKKMYDKTDNLFQAIEFKSALKTFAIQYQI